jgi:2,3-dihydro-2,3-dihydroxybenzoate dehydrogenase
MNALTTGGLEGRTALFVGAGSTGGIGFATATAMAAAGARVAIADMASTDVMSLGAEPPGEGHTAHTVDVTDRPSVDRLVAEVGATHGTIHALVNAAAILRTGAFLDADFADWTKSFSVNTDGAFHVAQAVARHMVAEGQGGRIVLIASNAARIPRLNNAAYSSSKAAVIQLVRCMALELGRHGITVNALCPGSTATTMLVDVQAKGDPSRLDGIVKGSIEQWRTGIPLERVAEPADQAAMCVFLASDGGRFVSPGALRRRCPDLLLLTRVRPGASPRSTRSASATRRPRAFRASPIRACSSASSPARWSIPRSSRRWRSTVPPLWASTLAPRPATRQ